MGLTHRNRRYERPPAMSMNAVVAPELGLLRDKYALAPS